MSSPIDNGLLFPDLVSYRTVGGQVSAHPKRGKHYVEPRGYAAKPGTGPVGETCGSCKHLYRYRSANTFPKCSVNKATWTHTRRTDVLIRAAACSKWEK